MKRREVLIKGGQVTLATLGASHAANALAGECVPTPSQATGPYYPEQPVQKWEDEDLTRVIGGNGKAQGTEMVLYGRVFENDTCRPVKGARVEIWQADDNGKYKHSRDDQSQPLDPKFQYYGKSTSDENGVYKFKTIVPGKYPGRTPHIHFRIILPNGKQLVTQLYFDNYRSANLKDGIYANLVRRGLADRVTVNLKKSQRFANKYAGQFDISISGKRRVPRL